MYGKLIILLFICLFDFVCGYASYLTQSKNCGTDGRLIAVGQVFMGAAAAADTTGKYMVIERNGVALSDKDQYVSGEKLTISVFGISSGQTIWEATGKKWQINYNYINNIFAYVCL